MRTAREIFGWSAKFIGNLWEAEIDHSPLDVAAWHGNFAPYKYDLLKFNCINTVTYDHPDPSIYCVLAAPTAIPGTSNIELGVFSAPLDRGLPTLFGRRPFTATSPASSWG